MAAILRSGKFLRIFSGLSKSGQQPIQQGSDKLENPENRNQPVFQQQLNAYHSISLQSLQNSLPILVQNEAKDETKIKDIPKEVFERRGSDPLLEFYVDKQKIEEAAKNIKHIGLNIVNEIETEKTDEIVVKIKSQNFENVRSKKSVEKSISVQVQESNVEDKIVENEGNLTLPTTPLEPIIEESEPPINLVTSENVENFVENFQVPQGSNEAHLVPLCEDPASHQWYPLPVVCQMFRAQGRIYDLESLLWGSQGIRPEDRKCIYYWTLQAYADCGMFPQAVDLTRRLEIEGLAANFPEYHVLMNNFAMAIYNQQQSSNSASTLPSSEVSSVHEQSPTPVSSISDNDSHLKSQCYRRLKKAIANKDVNECLNNYQGIGKKDLNITEASTLIELFVKADCIDEAVEITEKMLSREAYPLPRIFRFLLNRLASKGEVDAMTRIGDYLTPKIKKEVSYDNRLCNGYLAAGRAEDYLNKLITELDQTLESDQDISEENLQVLKDKFPRGGAMGLLESNPNLVKPYTKLALKFVDLEYVAPVNVLWTYHFINGHHDLAQPLWEKYVRTCPQIMFQKVCQTARSTSNVDLAERLVVLLENAVVTNGARGIAYSCLLDVLTQNKDFSKGLISLDIGLRSGVSLDDINRTALRRLKEGVEDQGIDFPYEIPQKSQNSTHDEENSIRSLSPMLN